RRWKPASRRSIPPRKRPVAPRRRRSSKVPPTPINEPRLRERPGLFFVVGEGTKKAGALTPASVLSAIRLLLRRCARDGRRCAKAGRCPKTGRRTTEARRRSERRTAAERRSRPTRNTDRRDIDLHLGRIDHDLAGLVVQNHLREQNDQTDHDALDDHERDGTVVDLARRDRVRHLAGDLVLVGLYGRDR